MAESVINLSEDGTKDAAMAADELFDAVAAAAIDGKAGVTWLVNDQGTAYAAIVPADRVAGTCLRHLQRCWQDTSRHADGTVCSG